MKPPTDLDKPLPWFRFDARFATDAAIRRLDPQTQLMYVLAMCATADRAAPCDDTAFAWYARVDIDTAAKAKAQLIAAGVVSDEWVPTDWHRQQPPVDRTNAERQARHRSRHRDRNAVSNARSNAVSNAPTDGRTDRRTYVQDGRTDSATHVAPASRPSSSDSHRTGKSPESRESKRTKFEAVHVRVGKAIEAGCPADDPDAIAAQTGDTPKQVRACLGQMRERGTLPKPKRGEPTPEEIIEARRKAIDDNQRQADKLGLANFATTDIVRGRR